MTEKRKIAVIIGAGPAGLTAALELLRRTDVVPIVLEAGECRRRHFPHRELQRLPDGHRRPPVLLEVGLGDELVARDPAAGADLDAAAGERHDQLPEPQPRVDAAAGHRGGRPGRPAGDAPAEPAFAHLFPAQVLRLPDQAQSARPWAISGHGAASRRGSRTPGHRPFRVGTERSLEDFLVNRFGGELYRTFFKSYTEKVWGVPCTEISAEWGAQRIKGLSLTRAVLHALRAIVAPSASSRCSRRADEPRSSVSSTRSSAPGSCGKTVADRVRRAGRRDPPAPGRGPGASCRRSRGVRSLQGIDRDRRTIGARCRLRDLDDAGARTWSRASTRPRRRRCGESPRSCRIATSSPSAFWCAG